MSRIHFLKDKDSAYKSLLPLAAFLVILAANCVLTKNFMNIRVQDGQLFGSLIDIGKQATPEILVALAMTLVIASKGIDLSVGAVAAIAGAVSALLLTAPNPMPLPAIMVIVLMIGTLAGIWNGILVSYLKVQPFIATLILMVAGRGIAQIVTGGFIITLPETEICRRFADLANGSFLLLPIRFYIVAILCALTWFLTRKTVVGTFIESVGCNEKASEYCGINANAVKLFVYAYSGMMAALAGMILTGDVKSADPSTIALRDHNELDAILAVIIGGTAFSGGRFNLFGTVIGALIMRTLLIQVFSSGWNWGHALVLKAVTVIVVCLIQSPSFRMATSKAFVRRSA